MTDLAPGAVFAGYRIDGVAGRGGMGVVYRATDLTLDRSVALKVIAAALAGDPGFRRRFIAESRTAASLDHANVVPIFHAGEHEGALFLVMRYVDGDLRSEIAAGGGLEPERAVRIVAQVASALDAAHAHGLVHRDVKPANVLLKGDHAYLADFGLSKRALADSDDTRSGQLLGTLNYLAPEQIRGEKVEPRTDVYALGCVLFHAVAGRVPFPMESQEATLWAHLSEPVPSVSSLAPRAPQLLDEVVTRAMAKAPPERFESAGDLASAALAAIDAGAPPAEPQRSSAPARRSAGQAPGVADAGRSPRPYTRHQYNRALIQNALLDPFNVAVLAVMLVAGILLGALTFLVPAALLIYLAAAARTYFDEDAQKKVLAHERAKRRHDLEEAQRRLEPGSFSPRIGDLLARALEREDRIRDAIDRAELPYTEVSDEVDRFLATMRHTAARAELLHEGLQDSPPQAIESRLAALKGNPDPDKAELIDALSQQLKVQRKMEAQLGRFYDQMEQMLVELDVVRGHLITTSASSEAGNQERLAADVRGLRDEMGAVADGMAAAYEEQSGSYAVLQRTG